MADIESSALLRRKLGLKNTPPEEGLSQDENARTFRRHLQCAPELLEEEEETRCLGHAITLTPIERRWITIAIYFIGFIDLFGVSMMIPLLPKLAFNLGASRTLSGFIGSLYGAMQVFSSPVVGRMSDVYRRKNVLLLSYFVSSLGYFSLSFSGAVWMLVLSRVPSGLLKHGLSISKAYLVDTSSASDRPSVLGYFNAFSSMGFIFGPLLSGYLADRDPTLKLSLLTGSIIYSSNIFIILIFLPSPGKNQAHIGKNDGAFSLLQSMNWNHFCESFNIFKSIHWRQFLDIITIRFLAVFSVMLFRSNFPVFLEENFSISNLRLGQIISFNGITSALGSATCGYISKYYTSYYRYLTHFIILLLIALICLSVSSSISQILIFLVLLSLSTSNLRIAMLNLLLHKGRGDERGAIIGFLNSLSSVSRMLAPSVAGLVQEYGSRYCAFFAAVMALVALGGALLCPVGKRQTGKEN